MNFIKKLIITPKLKKEIHKHVLEMINSSNVELEGTTLQTVKEFEDHLLKAKIALIDMSSYPIYERFIDGIRLGYFTWKEGRKKK